MGCVDDPTDDENRIYGVVISLQHEALLSLVIFTLDTLFWICSFTHIPLCILHLSGYLQAGIKRLFGSVAIGMLLDQRLLLMGNEMHSPPSDVNEPFDQTTVVEITFLGPRCF